MTVLAFPDHLNSLDLHAQPSLNSMQLHATKACTYLTLGHMFSNDKDKLVMRIHKVVFSTHNLVCLQLFCDAKRQETHPTQPCRRLIGCRLLSKSIVLLKGWVSLREQSRVRLSCRDNVQHTHFMCAMTHT